MRMNEIINIWSWNTCDPPPLSDIYSVISISALYYLKFSSNFLITPEIICPCTLLQIKSNVEIDFYLERWK